jgi:hypothetical protein
MKIMDSLAQVKGLPPPVKIVILLLAGVSVGGVVQMVEPRLTVVYLLGFAAIALLYILYRFVVGRIKKRQAAGFGVELNSTNTQAPSSINDPAKRARLDDLRKNFEKGIGRYKSAGKDVYSLPWLLVVGEPGSGKTEAIRHSSVGFPPGLQDELQGVGGTINMNWWFTNRAVILDTAGRLMFEEVEAGATSEWREFLGLLRKTRGNCPINGMLLVIPVDTLIKDSMEQITKKASKIAQQLDVIQRTLDVRFPVFVVITKCDLLNGFREFFDNLTDPQLQHQILGWSNPASLDEPFRADQVELHLRTVAESLSKRRLGLLRDPVPETPNGRRANEVDAFYSLPTSLTAIAPRLRAYLEAIFVAGEWSSKPLFMRGIYFSSAMREGSALDLELAQAIGVSVESLPDGKAWERERAYFLRDLFLDKIFIEKGLVTRATNTRALMRRRRLLTIGTAMFGLVAVLGLSILGYHSLYQSVGNESSIWQSADAGWNDNQWNPIVTPEYKGSTNYTYNGAQVIHVGNRTMTLVEYHAQLNALTRSNIKVPFIFWPMEAVVSALNPGRRDAQNVLFEISVMRPLVEAARTKISVEKGPWTPAASHALAVLIRLEGMIHNPDVSLTADDISGDNFLVPLLRYVAPQAGDSADLSKAFDSNYLAAAANHKKFPPAWLSGGGSLFENRAIATGLNRFFAQAQTDLKAREQGFDMIREIRRDLRVFKEQEQDLAHFADSITDPAQTARDGPPLVGRVVDARGSVDGAMDKLSASGLVDKNFASLFASYKDLTEKSRTSTETAFKILQSEINRFPVADADSGRSSGYTLPSEMSRLLRSNLQDLRDRVDTALTTREEQELQQLDELYIVRSSDGMRLVDSRASLYYRSLFPVPDSPADAAPLIGRLNRAVAALATNENLVQDRIKAADGKEALQAQLIARTLLGGGHYGTLDRLVDRYTAEIAALLAQDALFPITVSDNGPADSSLTVPAVRVLAGKMRSVAKDLASVPPSTWPPAVGTKVDAIPARVAAPSAITEAIAPSGDRPATVTITRLGYDDQRKLMSERLGNDSFAPNFVGNIWRTMRVGGNRFRTDTAAVDLGRFPLPDNQFTIDFFRGVDDPAPDRTFSTSADWAVMRLLLQPSTHRRDGGKEWEVMLPLVDETGKKRFLFLLLQFEKPLPEMSDWPTRAQLAPAAP